MLRGVSRVTVEVSSTGSRYFERAIVFVRPQYVRDARLDLHKEAKQLLDRLEYCVDMPAEDDTPEPDAPARETKKAAAGALPRLLALTASALAGAAAGAAIVSYL